VPTTEPESTQPATTEPATTEPATTEPATTEAATTEPTAVTSTSEPIVVAVDEDATPDSRTGTIMFIASVAAVLGIGAFVVYRSRQARGRTTNAD
jgi:uncharacterized protein HemX